MLKVDRKNNVLWNYIGIFFTYGFNIILLPFVLKFLEQDELGLWYTFASVGTTITLLDFGFSPCIMRHIGHIWGGAQEIIKNDLKVSESDNNINYPLLIDTIKTSRELYRLISIIVCAIAYIPGTIYIASISSDASQSYAITSWLLYALAITLNLYYNYWNAVLRGLGGVSDSQKANITAKLAQFVITLPGLVFGFGLYALSIAYLLSGLIVRYKSQKACIRIIGIDDTSLIGKPSDKDLLVAIVSNAVRFGLATLSTQLVAQSYQLICSSIYGLRISAEYGLSVQLLSVIVTVGFAYYNAVFPEINISRASGEVDRQRKLISVSAVIMWVIDITGSIFMVFIMPKILSSFTDKSLLSFYSLIILCTVYLIEYNRTLFTMYISTSNKLPYTYPVLFASILTSISAIILSQMNVKLIILLIIRLIIEIAYNGWKWMHVTLRELDLTVGEMLSIANYEISQHIKIR